MEPSDRGERINSESEIYLLIAKFLSAGPCKNAANALTVDMEENQLVPPRIDWEGNAHRRSFESFMGMNSHISPDYLPLICLRSRQLLEQSIKPSVSGVSSLLGAGRLSLLRTEDDVKFTQWKGRMHSILRNGVPLLHPSNLKNPPNICHVIHGRELCGADRRDRLLPLSMYENHATMHIRVLGHLSAVYCIVFDRTGRFIFTGADDSLIKVWSTKDCRLISTFRGHCGEITDMALNHDNTLLASGSCDKTLRVWCLRTGAQIAVLHGHTSLLTSVQFCPLVNVNDVRYLVSTGGDGCICFWQYSNFGLNFESKPIKFTERSRAGAQMLCSSFSPGGIFLATGSADQSIRVYSFLSHHPEKISEVDPHTDRVDSIQFSNKGDRFMSGSRDGTARIWRYERQEWHFMTLAMSSKLKKNEPEDPKAKLRVTMVRWSHEDTYVITAVSDFTIKLWNSWTGALVRVMEGHDDDIFVIEINPADSRFILTAGHDGKINLWSIPDGRLVRTFVNNIPGQGHGAVFDCKFSPDGQTFAATDSHGHLLIFGLGSSEPYQKVPQEQFFHTDYRPLIRDNNGFVLDEQTQQPPHLMPPPFLVDMDGCPHPIQFQKLVPGRENCTDSQLLPQIGTAENGDREVVGGNFNPDLGELVPFNDGGVHGEIDAAIANLRQENDVRQNRDHDHDYIPAPGRSNSPGRGAGVRRASGNNVPVSRVATNQDILAWSKRKIVRELDPLTIGRCEAQRKAHAESELERFLREKKRKPIPMCRTDSSDSGSYMIKTRRKMRGRNRSSYDVHMEDTAVNRLVTRALYDTEVEEESSSTDVAIEVDEEREPAYMSEKSDADSSEYSDWMADAQVNLQPPLRTSKRTRKRPRISPLLSDQESTDSDADDDDDDTASLASVETARNPTQRPMRKRKSTRNQERQGEVPKTEKRKRDMSEFNDIKELPAQFLPPEWLTAVIPRKAPYVPQMGDEIVYIRQGHQMYVNAVIRTQLYKIDVNKSLPYKRNPIMGDVEFVKVIGIKYEVRPPRLCSLKLGYINPMTGNLMKESFTIKYHDMPDVLDFLVLRQTFDQATDRHWKVGDRFCSIIDDAWWMGTIERQEPLDEKFPDSPFQCFHVQWDNGESELMSPWDLEPLEDHRIPSEKGASKLVSNEDHATLVYHPKDSEWPSCGRDAECDRLVAGLENHIMQLSIAEPFLVPVDLNRYPIYAIVIEYLIDLTTIRNRVENRYYRRISALQFDVRYIEINARKFNERGSEIIKSAKAITKLVLEFIRQTDCYDPMRLFHDLKGEAHQGSDSDTEIEDGSRKRLFSSDSSPIRKRVRNDYVVTSDSWKVQIRNLLQTVLGMDDSTPFREPVNTQAYPQYLEIIIDPMDLGTVLSKLDKGRYSDPTEVLKDLRLIFKNSKAFNNKKSKIYTMTLRLSAHLEEKFRNILSDWKSALRCEKSVRTLRTKARSSRDMAVQPHSSGKAPSIDMPSTSRAGEPQPSTSGQNGLYRAKTYRGKSRALRTRSGGVLPSAKGKRLDEDDATETESSSDDSDSATEVEESPEPPPVPVRKSRAKSAKAKRTSTKKEETSSDADGTDSGSGSSDESTSSSASDAENENDISTDDDDESDVAAVSKPPPKKNIPRKRARRSMSDSDSGVRGYSARKKRHVNGYTNGTAAQRRGGRQKRTRRSCGTPRYREDSDDDDKDHVANSRLLTQHVSSRGRLRKITERARRSQLGM